MRTLTLAQAIGKKSDRNGQAGDVNDERAATQKNVGCI